MDEKSIKTEIVTIEGRVDSVVVNDKSSFEIAGELTIECDRLIKSIKEYWKEPKEKAFQAHKAITAKEQEMLHPIIDRRNALAYKIKEYLNEQRRKQLAEQARLDVERQKREQAEREKLERAAARADEKGKIEKADELREKANDVFIAPTIIVPDIEKTTRMESGTVSQTKDIEVTITDEKALIAEIAMGHIPVSIVTFSIPKLKQFIKLQGITKLNGATITETVNAKFRGR